VDLRQKCPPVYDQLRLGSCTANAVAGAFEFEAMKQNLPLFSPSRLFIWYNARAKSGVASAVKRNVGCSLRNAIQSLNLKGHGVCSESEWPYEAAEYNKKTLYFTDPKARAATKPPAVVVQHAHLHAVSRYYAFTKDKNLLTKLLHCLDEGYPFLFGTPTYKLFSKVGKDGRGLRTKNTPGGHALLVVGYIHEEKVFIVRNSWGENWGEKGYFYMPYGWLKYAYDLWTIRVVTDTDKRKGTKKNDAKQKSTKA
ncbi:cysteine proteinase, partial [Marasmius fiardii PR-910]